MYYTKCYQGKITLLYRENIIHWSALLVNRTLKEGHYDKKTGKVSLCVIWIYRNPSIRVSAKVLGRCEVQLNLQPVQRYKSIIIGLSRKESLDKYILTIGRLKTFVILSSIKIFEAILLTIGQML